MKAFYLILCICFAVFIVIESKDEVKTYTEKLKSMEANYDACRNTSGVTIEFLEKLNKTVEELEAPEMEENRKKIGCFLSCLMQEKEIINGTTFNVQKMIDALKLNVDSSEEISQDTMDAVVGVVENCVKQVENMTNVCLIGWKFGKCVGEVMGV